ncbi:MAG: type II toxin-antitoxin system Phd/YefM family antitoxin [Candidatus Dormibacteraceae bacterium]
MPEQIAQRELRNDNAAIMRRVKAGERFIVTSNGQPVAFLLPYQEEEPLRPRLTLGEVQATFRRIPGLDIEQWHQDRAREDEIFAPDDPLEDPWSRKQKRSQ